MESRNIQLHFFEEARNCFDLGSLRNLFEPEAGRVSVMRESLKMPSCCLEGGCCVEGTCANNKTKSDASSSSPPGPCSCCVDGTCTSEVGKSSDSSPDTAEKTIESESCDAENITNTCCADPACCSAKDALEACCADESSLCSEEKKSPNEDREVEAFLENGEVESQPKQKGIRKSRFYASGICCASEIPAIKEILDPMEGVSSVSVNVAMRTVRGAFLVLVIGSISSDTSISLLSCNE